MSNFCTTYESYLGFLHSWSARWRLEALDSDDNIITITCDDISNYNPEHLASSSEDVEIIRDWLKATCYTHESRNLRKHLVSCVSGTSAWLTYSDAYCSWLNQDSCRMLWIKSIPGSSGKSVIAAHIVDALATENPSTLVLYFFF
jgi:hypothetical protein